MRPRKRHEYLRTRNGEQERRCIGCGEWKPEATEYHKSKTAARATVVHGRCRACVKEQKAKIHQGREAWRMVVPAFKKLPATVPEMTWELLTRWMK